MPGTGFTLTLVRDRLGEHAYQAFLEASPAGDFMQTIAWGKVKALTGWRSIPLLLQDAAGRVVLSALILARRVPGLPLSVLYAPRGPVLDWSGPPGELGQALRAFASEVRRLGGRHRAALLKCDPAVASGNAAARPALTEAGFRGAVRSMAFEGLQPRFVYPIDIRPAAEDLMATFSPKHRYNIRLAARKGVTVRLAEAEEDMRSFYRLLETTAARDRFSIRAYAYYQSIWREMCLDGRAGLFLAEHAGQALSGALIFVLGKKSWYVYGASSNEDRNLMPNYALHWTIMGWLKERGVEVYDMRGISGDLAPENPLYGLYRFKKGFSGRVVEYAGEFDLPLSLPLYWGFRLGLPLYRGLGRLLRARRRPEGSDEGH